MLSSQLLRRVLDTASTLAALDGDALDDGLPVLGQLLGADLVTYHRFDLLVCTEESVVCPEEALHEARRWPDYRAHLGQDPLLRHYATTSDSSARRLSDVAEVGVFHRSEVYQHYYRVAELRHQLALPVRGLPGQLIGFTLCRFTGRDFSYQDCETFSLLGPHLGGWCRTAVVRTLVRLRRAVGWQGRSETGSGLGLLVERGPAADWS